jgi:hypothetical protein
MRTIHLVPALTRFAGAFDAVQGVRPSISPVVRCALVADASESFQNFGMLQIRSFQVAAW